MDIKNVLVATDFSYDAYAALFYVSKLLAHTQCTFHIINSYDDLTSSNSSLNTLLNTKKELDKLHTESLGNLTQIAHRIHLDMGNKLHSYTTTSSKGPLSTVISKAIKDNFIDLVVMGNKGKTGAKELFMGSNTIKIANTIDTCPVLAIPKQMEYTSIPEIAFVTDFKKGCTRKTLEPLLFLTSTLHASIKIVHINEEDRMSSCQISNKRLLELALGKARYSFHDIYGYTDKAKVIKNYVADQKINMLAMAHHRKTFIENLFQEPVITDISIYANIPLLILPIMD